MPTAHPLFLYITFTVADPGGVEQRSLDIDVGRPLSPQPFAGSCRCMDGINRLQIPEDVIHDSYVQCGPYILISIAFLAVLSFPVVQNDPFCWSSPSLERSEGSNPPREDTGADILSAA